MKPATILPLLLLCLTASAAEQKKKPPEDALLAPLTASPQPEKGKPGGKKSELKPLDPTAVAREVRTIEVDESRANKVYRVKTAPGLPAIVEFPDDFADTPSCGDCVDGNAPREALANSSALFLIQVFAKQRYIAVKPLQYAQEERGSGPPMAEFNTTVTVRLQSRLTLTLLVEYAKRDEADPRTVFSLPNRSEESEYVKQEVARARATLEADYSRRVAESTTRELLTSLLEAPRCTAVNRHEVNGAVRLDVLQLCRMGNYVVVRFSVENRGQAPLLLGEATVRRRAGEAAAPVDGSQFHVTRTELEFRAKAAGVVAFTLTEGEAPAAAYLLHLTERSGDAREVLSRPFGF